MTNLGELKTIVKTGKKKTITGLLWGLLKGNHRRDSIFYKMKYTETAWIPCLIVHILQCDKRND